MTKNDIIGLLKLYFIKKIRIHDSIRIYPVKPWIHLTTPS